MNKKIFLLAVPIGLTVAYVLGPVPKTPEYHQELPAVPSAASSLDAYVRQKEANHKLKPDNEARIVWANDSLRQQTDYAILYLHGFSASQAEGEPVHRNIAGKFGCNLYLSRLAEHGIDTSEQLANLTADKYWESAKASFAIARQLGKKVIVMGTSTGGTLALMLAARYPEIASLVLLSPNVEIFDNNAWLLNNHWGLQIARMVVKSDYILPTDTRELTKKYWNQPYRLEGAVALQELLETSMNEETFNSVKQPTLLLYYYKDEVNQDSVVKVSAMLNMFKQLGTPDSLKEEYAMPKTGNHVIGSYIKSNDVEGVEARIEDFLRKKLIRSADNKASIAQQ